MNRVNLIGRFTAKPELRETISKTQVSRFILAVRRMKEETDFISCVAFNKTAETITKYFDKGSQIGIDGRIQTGSYDDKDGNKVYTTDVVVESITFLDKKESSVTPQDFEKEEIETDPFADFGEQVSIEDSFLD